MKFTARQEEIILKSMEIIAREGISALTIKNISGKVGVSEAALYRHFKNKDEILLSILDLFEKRSIDVFDGEFRAGTSDFENIYNILLKRTRDFMTNPAFVTIILSEDIFPQDSGLSKKVHEIMKINHDRICLLVEQGQKKGEIRKDILSEQFFNLIIGSFRFLAAQWRISDFGFDLEEKFKETWESLKIISLNRK
ncbi:MAG: TetR/AcrR family transcriptional regulator [Brevinematales bacterium]|jgi:AcrR family transcriptional regulator